MERKSLPVQPQSAHLSFPGTRINSSKRCWHFSDDIANVLKN